ncbi:MAG: hypothetical protein WAO08_03610, partial [Hyphomicrobiaceae bacterium]
MGTGLRSGYALPFIPPPPAILILIVAEFSPRLSPPRLALADLAEHRWILPPADTPAAPLAAEIFRAHGLE